MSERGSWPIIDGMLASLEIMRHRANINRSDTRRRETKLRDLERAGEVTSENRSYFGTLPEINLVKKTRLDRIVRVAKR